MIKDVIPLLPLVLAQSVGANSAPQFGWWLLGLAAAAVLLNQLAQAFRNLTGRFVEREPEGGFRRRSDCIAIHEKLASQLAEICSNMRSATEAQRKESRDDMGGVHRRIDALQTQISNLGRELLVAANAKG
jgi:hypothetical protein